MDQTALTANTTLVKKKSQINDLMNQVIEIPIRKSDADEWCNLTDDNIRSLGSYFNYLKV